MCPTARIRPQKRVVRNLLTGLARSRMDPRYEVGRPRSCHVLPCSTVGEEPYELYLLNEEVCVSQRIQDAEEIKSLS